MDSDRLLNPTLTIEVKRRSLAQSSVLGMAALAMVATLPGRTQGLGLITEPLLTTLNIDRVTYSELNFWATIIGAAFCLPCGRLIDRMGPRAVLTAAIGALGLTVVVMSEASGVAQLAILLTLTRGFGQSALSVVSLTVVGKYFAERIHMAMGLYSLMVGVGFIVAFPSVGQAAVRFGWRAAWLGVGLTLLLIVAPLGWLSLRKPPAGSVAETEEASEADALETDLTVADALRSPAFWIFALASSLFGLVYSGIALFNQSILEERGFDASTYHLALVISTLVGLAANFAGGWISTRVPVQKVMAVGMSVLAGSVLMLPFVSTLTEVATYAIAMGLAGGIVTVVFFSVWAQVFGRTHLGRIQGVAQMMTVLASAIGPVLLARTLASTGSYRAVFLMLAAVVFCFGVASWVVRLPDRRAARTT
ncbi:MAG TPA: MFS transporter [Bryobacteraceae bacterium]|nr:MFS transporter [Bryobacteraceae bacterium]